MGMVRVRYISADLASALTQLENRQITLFDITAVDEVTLEFQISEGNLKSLLVIAKRRGEKAVLISRDRPSRILHGAAKRPLLLVGLLLFVFIAVLLPTRIIFIEAEANEQVPSARILEAAEESGLGFWSDRRAVRSEQLKNRLLDRVPELKWAGVNTYGSRAVITVREREDEREADVSYPLRHIVAARDGIITSCTVTSGSGSCTVGQAVKQGDILISAYTDCGITIRCAAANGRVEAATERNLSVITPSICQMREENTIEQVRYSLILGKKRINFYKGSGISGSTCVKMYSEYVLTLPGGFRLPLSLEKETLWYSQPVPTVLDDQTEILRMFASTYLDSQMILGTVLKRDESIHQYGELWILEGKYACIEDIGIVQDEKIGDLHG